MAAEHFFVKARSLSFERFLQKIRDFLKNLLLNLYIFNMQMLKDVQIPFSVMTQQHLCLGHIMVHRPSSASI